MSVEPSEIPADRAKRTFGDLLGRVCHGGESLVITKHGKPVAALVPLPPAPVAEIQDQEGRAVA